VRRELVLPGLLVLVCAVVESAEVEVAVGEKGAHAKLFCQDERLLEGRARRCRIRPGVGRAAPLGTRHDMPW
jgi:hypothetical protein